jgi:hypothetical protein
MGEVKELTVDELREQLEAEKKARAKAEEAAKVAKEKAKEAEKKARAKEDEELPPPVDTTPAAQKAYLEERVPFRAFKDNDKYKNDLDVTVNGKRFLIQRGITVLIPRYVLLALENSERQQAEAADTSKRFENQYEERLKQNPYGM